MNQQQLQVTTGMNRGNESNKFINLPFELILLILNLSFFSGQRKESYKNLMLISKRFVEPARILLHRDISVKTSSQALSLLSTLETSTNPNLNSSTKKLNLIYSIGNLKSQGGLGAVESDEARELLKLFGLNLRELTVLGDDGMRILVDSTSFESNSIEEVDQLQLPLNSTTPTSITTKATQRRPLENLQSLTILSPSIIRYNDLLQLIQSSSKLKFLSISGLIEPLPVWSLPPLTSLPASVSSYYSTSADSVASTSTARAAPTRSLTEEEQKRELIRIRKRYERIEKLANNTTNTTAGGARRVGGMNQNRWLVDLDLEDDEEEEGNTVVVEDESTPSTSIISRPLVPLILLPTVYLPLPHPHLSSFILSNSEISAPLLSSILASLTRTLRIFKLINTNSITRGGFCRILERGHLRGLVEFEVRGCDFDNVVLVDADANGGGNQNAVPVVVPVAPRIPPVVAIAHRQPQNAQSLQPAALNRMPVPTTTNTTTTTNITNRIIRPAPPATPLPSTLLSPTSPSSLLYPLDSLPTHCPFLQDLTIASEKLASPKLLVNLKGLPLANLGLDFARPSVSVRELGSLLNGMGSGVMGEGGMESLWVGKLMKWTKVEESEFKLICFRNGVLVRFGDD